MARTVTGIWWTPTTEGTPALVVTAAFFTLGGLTGCLLAFRTTEMGAEAMAAYLDHFLTAAQAGGLNAPALPELLWQSFRWLLAAFLLGFSALGVLGVPVLCSMRGFFLAYSIASFAQAYGRNGLMVAFLLLGLPGFLFVPAFLLSAVQGFSAACAMAGRPGRRELPFHREYFFCYGACATAMCIGLLMERYLVPVLVSGAAEALLR